MAGPGSELHVLHAPGWNRTGAATAGKQWGSRNCGGQSEQGKWWGSFFSMLNGEKPLSWIQVHMVGKLSVYGFL